MGSNKYSTTDKPKFLPDDKNSGSTGSKEHNIAKFQVVGV